MKPIYQAMIWAAVLSVLATAGMAAAPDEAKATDRQGDAPPAERRAPADVVQPKDASDDTVQMAEIRLERATFRGRVLYETDEMIRIESYGHGAIGYRKRSIGSIKRFTLTPAAYCEELGDFHHQRAWQVEDGAAQFSHARQAYLRALARRPTADERFRLETKLELVAEDRDEWQKEALRQAELNKAQQEVELVKLQKELAREELTTLRRQEEQIEELRKAISELQDQTLRVVDFIERIHETVEDLEDDMDRLRRLDRVFITHQIFTGLRRQHDALKKEVERLERKIGAD